MEKSHLRVALRKVSDTFVFPEGSASYRCFQTHLLSFLRDYVKSSSPVATYFSSEFEAPTHFLLKEKSFRWAFPKMKGEDLEFYFVNKEEDLVENSWGIKEPDEKKCERVSLESCPCVLVPGLGFDRDGGRLGRGKGFFDRALSSFKGLKVGLLHSLQIIDENLKWEKHDVKMDFLITEKFILKSFGVL